MPIDVAKNLLAVKARLPEGVSLTAVSKYHPEAYITAAYNAGQRVFGESHEQELARKAAALPKDIDWHFIGHLQTNKVKYIAPYIGMIESVDSLRLLREIDKQGTRCGRCIRVLLELHIAEEATKYGLTIDDCRALLDDGQWRQMQHVQICGIMMMASFTDDSHQIAQEMDKAHGFFNEVKNKYFSDSPWFCCRSWGMSGDYAIAVKHGSNMVRVGTAIFGERVY